MTTRRITTEATVTKLRAAFERVQNPDDWKGPIRTTIAVGKLANLDVIAEAVEFYTATEAKFEVLGRIAGGAYSVLVTAPGYYAGPAA